MSSALLYAHMSKAVYSMPNTIGKEGSSAKAVVGDTPDGVTVGFPGTENIPGFISDMQAIAVHTPLGRVHEGFWNAYLTIAEELMALSPAVLYGHSLGADLALIYGGMLCLAGKPPKAIYGFEPARVSCDSILYGILSSHGVKGVLTQNGNDLVPQVPRILKPWRHPFPITHIGNPALPFDNLEDHEIDRVIAALI